MGLRFMAKQMTDLILDDTDDLVITTGDFIPAESTAQHQRQLILNNKGDFKQNPTICVGAFEYLDDENFQELIRAISVEFTRDGMDVTSVRLLPGGEVKSIAVYK